jgi:hypothetical protein
MLGSVAGAMSQPGAMTETDLELIVVLLALSCVAVGGLGVAWRARVRRLAHLPAQPDDIDVRLGIGTVTAVHPNDHQVIIDVEAIPGQQFTGRLHFPAGDPVVAALRPGSVVLVAFDPIAREHLSLPNEIVAVRAAFDRMLIRKGLATAAHLDLIRHGVRTSGVVTAVRPTGVTCEDHCEVELDLMVRRTHGGQFPARETTLVPVSAAVAPGSIVDTYYQPGDETAIAVCVPHA